MICYDLRYQPLSIGDFVDYMEWSHILGEELCYSYDPENPTIGDPGLRHINKWNFAQYFEPFKSLCDVVYTHKIKYQYPTVDNRFYQFYNLYNNVFSQGVKPLPFKSDAWAKAFLLEHGVKYCIQIRVNPHANNNKRNTPVPIWRSFVKKRPERFLMLGECAGFRGHNTVIAKDFGTTIEQDLALAAACDVYLGPPSGPAGAVIFNDKPYRIFNATVKAPRCSAVVEDGCNARWKWAKHNQVMTRGIEDLYLIEREFEACLKSA